MREEMACVITVRDWTNQGLGEVAQYREFKDGTLEIIEQEYEGEEECVEDGTE